MLTKPLGLGYRKFDKMRYLIPLALGVMTAMPAAASELTDTQKTGMYRHGNWMWSIENCEGVARNKRYWFHLKEGGEFQSFSQISANLDGYYFKRGWQYMQQKAAISGHLQACTYAKTKWPGMLWSKKDG